LAIVGILLVSAISAGRISRWGDAWYPLGALMIGAVIVSFTAYLIVVVMYAVTDIDKVEGNRLLSWLEWKYKVYKNRDKSINIDGIIVKVPDDEIEKYEPKVEELKCEEPANKAESFPYPLNEIYSQLNQENRPDADVIALTSGVHREDILLNTLEFYSNNLHLRSKGQYVNKDAEHICYCAIGRLLTNRELRYIVTDNSSNTCNLSMVLSILPDRIKMKGSEFLGRLQVLHDSDMNWSLDGTLSEQGQEFLFSIITRFDFNGENFKKYFTDESLIVRLNDYIDR
jgi:hypothetical protein